MNSRKKKVIIIIFLGFSVACVLSLLQIINHKNVYMLLKELKEQKEKEEEERSYSFYRQKKHCAITKVTLLFIVLLPLPWFYGCVC